MIDNLPRRPPTILLIIFGLALTLLSVEGVYFLLTKNKSKVQVVETPKTEGSESKTPEKLPIPDRRVESIWEGKKTVLVKGKVSNFDINGRRIDLILEDNLTKTIEIDDKTGFIELSILKDRISPKLIDVSAFWQGLKKEDKISCSCYEDSDLAVSVAKEVD